jgi:hypothetical protein
MYAGRASANPEGVTGDTTQWLSSRVAEGELRKGTGADDFRAVVITLLASEGEEEGGEVVQKATSVSSERCSCPASIVDHQSHAGSSGDLPVLEAEGRGELHPAPGFRSGSDGRAPGLQALEPPA